MKITDVGAYITGTLLGRHKLIPRISPGKTWEGAFGGVTVAVITSITFLVLRDHSLGTVQISTMHAAVLGLLLGVVGTVGDLFESLLKRASGAKDSGAVVPGMGGLLDVLDSLLFAAPVLYVYLRLFL